jgi:hypothetical protein
MRHQQILDKLAARFLVQALDESFARAMTWGITAKEFSLDLQNQIWQKILSRWDCVLQEEDKKEVSAAYKQKTILAMAVTAHKYGLNIDSILPQALAAIDALNAAVELSDDFERRSPQIKAFLQTPPQPLKRRPVMPDNITFFRPQDVVSIQSRKRFYAAYVHRDTGINECPVIEFYDGVFDHVPSLEEIQKLPARGAHYQDGRVRISRYAVAQMKYLPDPANQVKLIAAAVAQPPSGKHLEASVGLYELTDIFALQKALEYLFRTT